MKIHAETGDQKHEVELKREGANVYADIDGRKYELTVSEPEPNVFLFNHEGKVYEATVTPSAKIGGRTHVRIGTNEIDVKLIDPKRLRSVVSENEHGDGLAEITTAMPGKVVRVLVEVGNQVAKGDSVLVVEAMKMQNELKSPKDGIVKDIRTEEGSTVSAGDILATIE